MTDDIQAEAERLMLLWIETEATAERMVVEIAAALRRQRELHGLSERGWRDRHAYERGLVEGARQEREAIAQYVAEEWPRQQTKELKHRPPLNLNDGHDHYRWIAASIRARGEKP